nr:MAG TPA: DNA circularization protein [Caudoviricetes sp.]
MSVLSEQLQPASFRGVPFEVEASGITVGRRTVVHEYPQRDRPYVEDMGRATRNITLQCFVVGSDYLEQAQALMHELEEPGPGTLIHPWLGEMEVTITSVSELLFDQGLGVASVTITATEAGDLEFPAVTADEDTEALEAADAVEKSAVDKFCEDFDLSTINDWIDSALEGSLLDALNFVSAGDLGKLFDYAEGVANLADKAMALLSTDPKIFATRLAGALGLSRWATTVSAWRGVAKSLKNLCRHDKLKARTKAYAERKGEPMSDVTRQVMKSQAAIETLVRQLLIAQMVGVSTLVATSKDVSSPDGEEDMRTTTRSYDEIVELRDELCQVLDDELLMEENDEMYQVLDEARTAIFDVLTHKADALQHVVIVKPDDVFPAVVLAYDYHDDADRDLEIARRNSVEHEGFCPASELRVLSE